MSLDPEPSPSSSRDRFFPSPTYIHSSSYQANIPKYSRRFSAIPRHSQHCSHDRQPPRTPTFRNVSLSDSTPYTASTYVRGRRRVEFDARNEISPKAEERMICGEVGGDVALVLRCYWCNVDATSD